MRQERAPLEARVSQAEAAPLYDRLAKLYDVWGKLTESRARNRALELVRIRDGQAVLEVATGTGLAFVQVVQKNPSGRNIGIDISQGMLSVAKKRLQRAGVSNFELSVGSAFDIQEKDHSFDIVLNNYMFDLLDETSWPKALAEYHRVLKPDGRLILVNMTTGEKFGSGLYESLYKLSPRLMGGCRGVRLTDPLVRNGFSIQQREYIQQLFFPSEVILASKKTA